MVFVAPTIQPGHGYVVLVGVFTAFVATWAGFKVGAARKKYGIKYPQMYAEKGEKCFIEFNCVQRAHQNVVENLPVYYTLLLSSSIFRPEIAAIAGLTRSLGFVAYVIGYSSGNPEKRMWGGFGYLGLLASLGLSFEAAYRLITSA
ncbi:Aste57867_8425 [Aphanomyces stellatus]|uniref:Aste57867_8425 protein n=1 Tax=Aphanomyces stellatus TaxID=120398 RepID=A0A485KKA4_9STRA|nr:hypothetical protein As57867_008393 [Aphanomyces stellatus]VFT85311.1 Aste57867_8425 [Aphanomyces stellatus]